MKQIYRVDFSYNCKFYVKTHAEVTRLLGLVDGAVYVEGIGKDRQVTVGRVDEDIPIWESQDSMVKEYFNNITAWRKAKGKLPQGAEEAWHAYSKLDYDVKRNSYDYEFKTYVESGDWQEQQEAA